MIRNQRIHTALTSMLFACSLCLIIFFLAVDSFCAEVDVTRFVDTYHAVRVKDPQDYMSSRTRVRLETIAEGDDASMFASFNASKNHIIPSQTGFELREAYLEYAAESWDLRVGRQIIIWGTADGVEITDVISPKDYTEFLARDYDDIRIPVDAAKFRYLRDQMSVELIWVPVFQSAILPEEDSPWAFKSDTSEDTEISYMAPEKKLENSEIGGKISLNLPGVDLAFSSLYTWNKTPTVKETKGLETTASMIDLEHHRLALAGVEFSVPYHSLVFRGESAFSHGTRFEPENPDDELFEKNSINSLVGVDWYPGDEWTISAQFAHQIILSYDEKINDEQHQMLATFNVSKSLLRNTLTLSTAGYMGLNDSELFDRSSIDYEVSDGLHLEAGIDVFVGDEGMFGQYKDNSEIWIKAKYSF